MNATARLGRVLADVAGAAVTPLVPQDYLELVAPLRGPGLRAKVVGVRRETAQAVTVELRPGRGWAGHAPGQYLRVGVDVDGVRQWRSYSITSPPGRRTVSITVRQQGLVSDRLAGLARGDVLALGQAAGDFRPGDGPVLFVAAGSGITPVMGILRSSRLTDAVLVHISRSPATEIFGAELQAMADAGDIRLIAWHSARDGRFAVDRLPELVPDIAARQGLVCGPGELIDDVTALYAAKGWPAPLHERFQVVRDTAGQGGRATFTRSRVSADAAGDTALLEAGEAAGVLMPFGCRMGICYGCVVPLTEGSVRDLRDGSLTTVAGDEPVPIQTCIHAAAGPCALDV